MKEKLRWFYRKEVKPDINGFFLLLSLTVFTFLRLPSLFEPEWYGDEGIYQVIGRALLSGRLLYSEIWDNKPPLLYIYYSLVNGDLFWIRLLSLMFGMAAIISFFYLARNLFQKKKLPVYSSTIFFSFFFGVPLIEGNIANAENFMLFPITLSLLIITRLKSSSKSTLPFAAGALLSIAFLTKIVAVFDFVSFILILFTLRFFNKPLVAFKRHTLSSPLTFIKALKQEGIFIISFIAPLILTGLFFLSRGAFFDFIRAIFSQNIGYVGYGNFLLIPQGFLILKLFLLFFAAFVVIIYRKKLGAPEVVVYLWLIFSVFNAFFSGRPYTHYVLVLLAPLSLLLGIIFSKKKNFSFNLFIFILLLVFVKFNFIHYTKITPYYKNYLEFIIGEKSVPEYQAFFDRITPVNYKIADFIKVNTKENENVFILSDSSTIYVLSNKLPPGRYIVEYHISFYNDAVKETLNSINFKKPKYIISTKDRFLNEFIKNYELKYNLEGIKIYERQI